MKIAKIITNNTIQLPPRLKSLEKVPKIVAKSGPVIIALTLNHTDKKNEQIRTEKIKKEIEKSKELHTSNHPVADRTKINEEALKKAGIPKSERKKFIDKDGYMTEEGKKICKDQDVTSFKGNPDDEVLQINESCSDDDFILKNPDTDDIINFDISMPEELENIIDMPQEVINSELMSNIMDALPEGFTPDADLLSNLKEMTGEILDMMG